MRGMIIECVGCGFGHHISLDGKPEDIENACHETITSGWRYEKSRDGYLCPKCRKNGLEDKLLELYVGKPKPMSKVESYKKLIIDMAIQIKQFQWLDEIEEVSHGNQTSRRNDHS